MDAHQFLARLCALVPPPGFHMTRYYGVSSVVSDADAIARILHGARAPPAPPPLGQVLLFA